MASPSNPQDDGANPFAKYLKPLPGRHEDPPDAPNPFDKYVVSDLTSDVSGLPPPVADRIANADPYVQELIAKGVDPERAAMYASERGHPYQAFKREMGEAGESLKKLGSAIARPFYIGAESTLLPLDAAHAIERFASAGDYSPTAFRNLALTGPDEGAPSQQAQAWLDAHTIAPDDTKGRIAEMISSGLAGSKLPGMPPSPKPPMRSPTLAQQAIAAGERHNVPVYFDDLTKSAFAKKLGTAAENIPVVGTSAGRAAQAEAAQAAAQKVAEQFGGELADDVPMLMQKGLKEQLDQFRGVANVKYSNAAALLDKAGIVPTPRFVMAIRRELMNQRKLGTAASADVVALLKKYQLAPEGDFSLARKLRSQLKHEVSEFYSGKNAAIGETGVERLRDMRNALEADMEAFAKKTGGKAYEAWKDADDFYKTNLIPFKERGFAELVNTAEPEKAWRYLMTQGGIESRAERMYNGLTEQGRAAVRAGAVRDAMNAATGPKGTFSPARFAKYMEDHETVINQFFKGADKEEIKGFTNLMRHVERAGQYMENPPTGQRLIAAAMLGGGTYYTQSLKPLILAASTAAGTRALFQTKRGRDLLLASSKLKPGSPTMTVLGNRLGRMAVGASMAPDVIQDEETPDAIGE